MKIANEGWPRIAAFLLVSLFLFALNHFLAGFIRVVIIFLAALSLLLAGFMAYFFRDPDREYPAGANLILSPADGKVMDVSGSRESSTVKIFMSPMDVHVQRSPVSGIVEQVEYTPGKFMRAYKPEAFMQNERNTIKIRDDKLEGFEVVQIAGILARRIKCRVKEGYRVSRGERIGMIMLGSQVNIKMPSAVKVNVKQGDRVTAGVTVIGKLCS